MNDSSANFRIIFTITDVLHELKMASSTLKILLAGTAKHIPLPCVKPVPLDFANVPTGSKIEFDLEDNNGHIYGYSELAIPQSAYKTKETQINQQIPFYLNKKEKESVNATVFLIFLNTDTFTPLTKFRSPTKATPARSTASRNTTPRKSNSISSSRPQTPSKQIKSASKVYSTPQKKTATPQRNVKTEEKMMHKYVDNLFDEYSHGFENLVKEHYELQEQADLIMKSQRVNPSGLQSQNSLEKLPIGSPIKASAIPQPATFGDAISVSGTPMERRQTGQFYQGENEVISMRGVQPADEERYSRAQTMPDEYERTMSYKKEVSKSQSPTKIQTQESPCRARKEIVERYRSDSFSNSPNRSRRANRSPSNERPIRDNRTPSNEKSRSYNRTPSNERPGRDNRIQSNEKPKRENPKPAVFINLRSDSFRSEINASQEPPSFGSRLDISQSIQLHDNSFTDPNNVSVMRNTSRNQSPRTFRKKAPEAYEESQLNTSFGNETEQSPKKGRNSYTAQKSQATSRATSPAKRKTSTPGRASFAQQQQSVQNQDSGAVLGKDLTSNFAYGDITYYKAQIEELQGKLLIRNTELLNKENLKTENEDLKIALRRSEEARRELQQKNTAAVRELNLENHQLQKEVAKHIEEKQAVNTKNASLQNKMKELERELENRSRSLHAAESRNAIFNHEIEELRVIRDQLERTQGMIDEAETLRLEERDSYKMSLVSAQKDLHETKVIIERLTHEKKHLAQELHMTRGDLEQEKMAVQELKDQLFITNKEFNNAQNFRLVIDSLEQEKQELTQTVRQIKQDHLELSELFEKARLDFAEKVTRAEENEHNLLNKISKLGEERQLCRETIDHLSVEINQLNLKLSSLSSQSTALEHITAIKEDIEDQLEFAQQQLDKSNQEKEMLAEQIITLSQEHQAAHKKIFDLEEAAAELRTTLTHKDDHISELKQLVVETKEAQALYFPEKDDNIDYALARFINSRSEPGKLRVMFMRESKGVYQFGSKKINVKVEGDKILIRVGGGYLSIEQFLDQCYYFQSEKMARSQSPVKQMTMPKNATPSKGSANKSLKHSPLNRTLTY